ncbi:hypothetical protein [Hymenobacter koreensis]|uniref:Amino acid ABC transporter permease n=1 Tax=Hymenobacter koreensis TaxID=1084523 RepID=A0ABP8J5M5_9BACT
MNRFLIASNPVFWLRELLYALFQAVLLLAYLLGALSAWRRGLHGAGRHYWAPARPVRFTLRAA